jgi:hypothetical protein
MQRLDFQAAYRESRRMAVDQAVDALQAGAVEAAGMLCAELKAKRCATRINAAVALLDRCMRGTELVDALERIAPLERNAEAAKGRQRYV